MKQLISPPSGTTYMALSEGCSLWAPVLPQAADSTLEHPPVSPKGGTRLAGSGSDRESDSSLAINLNKETS